jgi:uncharacterized protein YraI
MDKSMKVRRALAAGTVALAALGGTVALAGPASAVGSSACTSRYVNAGTPKLDSAVTVTHANVRLRSGPSTNYRIRATLGSWTAFHAACSAKHYGWVYGKVVGGPYKGHWGWVASRYTGLNGI